MQSNRPIIMVTVLVLICSMPHLCFSQGAVPVLGSGGAQDIGTTSSQSLVLAQPVGRRIVKYSGSGGEEKAALAEKYWYDGSKQKDAGRYSKALVSYTMSLWCDPSYTKSLFGRATVSIKMSLYEQALADLSKLIEMNSRMALYYYNRARVLLKLNRVKDAFDDFLKAHMLDDRYPKPKLNERKISRNYS